MSQALGQTQMTLLRQLRGAAHGAAAAGGAQGATMDELAAALQITRTAVRQHLVALERDGYVKKGERVETGGRPVQRYTLADKGLEVFPKQYAWFAELLLNGLADQSGEPALEAFLVDLGQRLAKQYETQVAAEDSAGRIARTALLMQSLCYEAEVKPARTRRGLPVIEAHNCIYHHLASRHPEVCELDLALLQGLTGSDVRHAECMVRGGRVCRFEFSPPRKR